MIRLSVMYPATEGATFDHDYYRNQHVPLAMKTWGLEGTAEIARILSVIGSGGVATVAHLNALAQAGAEGAIVGTALYERHITLQQALAATC